MIGSLRGSVVDKNPEGEIVIEVAGVGYRVSVNPRTLGDLSEVGAEAFVHIHHHIREDDQQLYGFATLIEQKCAAAMVTAAKGPARRTKFALRIALDLAIAALGRPVGAPIPAKTIKTLPSHARAWW